MDEVVKAIQYLEEQWGEVDDFILAVFLFLLTAPQEKRIELLQPFIKFKLSKVYVIEAPKEMPNHLVIGFKSEGGDGTMIFGMDETQASHGILS